MMVPSYLKYKLCRDTLDEAEKTPTGEAIENVSLESKWTTYQDSSHCTDDYDA
jgi:hypothetical protein